MINMCDVNSSWITTPGEYNGYYTYPYCKCSCNNNCKQGIVVENAISSYENPLEPLGEKTAIEEGVDIIPTENCSTVDEILAQFEKDIYVHFMTFKNKKESIIEIYSNDSTRHNYIKRLFTENQIYFTEYDTEPNYIKVRTPQ